MTDLTGKIDKYLIRNGVTEYKNEDTKEYLYKTMLGGCESNNNNIFKWTMQKLNANQRTMLKGGRVAFPAVFFGAKKAPMYTSNPKFTVSSDVTPTHIRPALAKTSGGRRGILSQRDISSMLQSGGYTLNLKDQKILYNEYNNNLQHFMDELGAIQAQRGGLHKINKRDVNNILQKLKAI
jgi:hypothetical protein